MTDIFHRLLPADELKEGAPFTVKLNGWPLLVVRADDDIHAVLDRCSHAGFALSGGKVRRGVIMCPVHGARFELASGRCLGGTYRPLRTFPIRVVDGWIEAAVPEKEPGPDIGKGRSA